MIVQFEDALLQRLYEDASYHHHQLGSDVIRSYRKLLGLLHAVSDAQELRNFKAYRWEELYGDRKGQSSLHLHGGHRLIVRFDREPNGRAVVGIRTLDYHQEG